LQELYTAYERVFYQVINRLGNGEHHEDLLQEMYFALNRAIEEYAVEETREKFPFFAVVKHNAHNRAMNFLKNLFHFSQKTNSFCEKPLSLNILSNGEDDDLEMLDTIADTIDIARQTEERQEREERRKAAAALWAEVEKLPPTKKALIIGFYKENKGISEIAFELNIKTRTAVVKKAAVLRELSEIQTIQEISLAYGVLPTYQKCTAYYVIKDPSLLNGNTYNSIARFTGLSPRGVAKCFNGDTVQDKTAKSIASFLKLPLETAFEKVGEPPKKAEGQRNASGHLVGAFVLINPEAFADIDITDIDKTKLTDKTASSIMRTIRNLRNGGYTRKNVAEVICYVFDLSFDDTFKPFNACWMTGGKPHKKQ
jgi:RNA polymerase sigma factor (sigma-70 family)